jgi:hypothetical protein
MARTVIAETRIPGLNDLLRDLRYLPKEAAKELRATSAVIADRYMVPSWREAAMKAGPWGEKLAASVKAKKDRIPAIQIGGNRKVFRGGATANMVRYPSSSGQPRESWAPFTATNWIGQRKDYHQDALNEWSKTIDDICARW